MGGGGENGFEAGPPEAVPVVLPSALRGLVDLDKRVSWKVAMAMLADAGFDLVAQASRAKAGGEPSEARLYAMLCHSEGFLVTMSSYFDGNGQGLNQLRVHRQTDVGANIHGIRRESFGSGSSVGMGDGASIHRGDHDVVTGRVGSLGWVLEDSYRHAKPLPFDLWEPLFVYVDPALFTDAPAEAFGAARREVGERFAQKIQEDWREFVDGLPASVARVILSSQYEDPPTRGVVGGALAGGYFARQLKALGKNWPSPDESGILASWSRSIGLLDLARSELLGRAGHDVEDFVAEGKAREPLELSNPGSAPLGCVALHALASIVRSRREADSGMPDMACQWVLGQPPGDVEKWLGTRDARGRTPAGVALESWLEAEGGGTGVYVSPFFEMCLANGWLGAPGELGQVACDALAPGGASKSLLDKRPALEIWHARFLDRVEQASRAHGHSWIVPLRTDGGATDDPAVAIAALLDKHGKAEGPAKAYLEGLAMRVVARDAKASASASPRL